MASFASLVKRGDQSAWWEGTGLEKYLSVSMAGGGGAREVFRDSGLHWLQ